MEADEAVVWKIYSVIYKLAIGTICLWNFSETKKEAEIGYDLLSNFQGKGFMSETMQAVIKYGFNTLNLDAIEACTHKENIGSVKLLEKYEFKLIPEEVDIPDNIICYLKK